MTKFSPGTVQDQETLIRFVWGMHFKNGKVLPALFSHAEQYGCSIQRQGGATIEELRDAVTEYLNKNPQNSWKGVVLADAASVRAAGISDLPLLRACVYDTALESNRAHGEFGWAEATGDEHRGELRRELMKTFRTDRLVSAQEFMGGAVWKVLSPDLQR